MNAQSKSADEMRMSTKEFDRIMSRALRVKPGEVKRKQKTTARKKQRSRK